MIQSTLNRTMTVEQAREALYQAKDRADRIQYPTRYYEGPTGSRITRAEPSWDELIDWTIREHLSDMDAMVVAASREFALTPRNDSTVSAIARKSPLL